MISDKKSIKTARKTFQSSLKSSRIHYRREKKAIQIALPKKRFLTRRAEKAEAKEQKKTLKEAYQDEKAAATETFKESIAYVSPRWLKAKEIRKYRLPQARNRLKLARKHLAEVKLEEKEKTVNPKITYHKESKETKTSRFQFQKEKNLDRLQAEKEVTSAKREVHQLKKAHKAKKTSTKVKRGLRFLESESLDVVAQDDDLEGLRTLKDTSLKGRRYARFTYQAGKVVVKGGR